MQKTSVIKKDDLAKDWYILDATGVRLGKLATKCAELLIGKNKPSKTTNMLNGDAVIVVNASSVDIHDKKKTSKMYTTHSTYRGGFKQESFNDLLAKFPERIIEKAVMGMLPKTKLRQSMFKNLFVYAGDKHEQEAQKPTKIVIK